MKLKFYSNLNVDKFLRLVKESYGNVLLRLSDNSICNLKTETMTDNLIRQEIERGHGIEVHLTDMDDCTRFTKLMIGAYV